MPSLVDSTGDKSSDVPGSISHLWATSHLYNFLARLGEWADHADKGSEGLSVVESENPIRTDNDNSLPPRTLQHYSFKIDGLLAQKPRSRPAKQKLVREVLNIVSESTSRLSESNSKLLRASARAAVGKIHTDFQAQEQQARANLLVRLKRTSTDQAALAVMLAAAREGLSHEDVMTAATQHEMAVHDANFAHRVYGPTLKNSVRNRIWIKGRDHSSADAPARHDAAANAD